MKSKIALSALLLCALAPSLSQAKIDVKARVSVGSSLDKDATQLMKVLKGLGVTTHTGTTGEEELMAKGQVTITNGAACDNGHQTYSVTLTTLDREGKEVSTKEIDGSDKCTSVSTAERLTQLLGKWGGNTLEGSCGLGHCWQTIESINCTHFSKSAKVKAFDSCDVVMNSNN